MSELFKCKVCGNHVTNKGLWRGICTVCQDAIVIRRSNDAAAQIISNAKIQARNIIDQANAYMKESDNRDREVKDKERASGLLKEIQKIVKNEIKRHEAEQHDEM